MTTIDPVSPDAAAVYRAQAPWVTIDEPVAIHAEAAILRDSAILRDVVNGRSGPVARVWENAHSLVTTRKECRFLRYDVACEQLTSQGWPVVARDSGGTTVPHQPGIVNYSLIFPQFRKDRRIWTCSTQRCVSRFVSRWVILV